MERSRSRLVAALSLAMLSAVSTTAMAQYRSYDSTSSNPGTIATLGARWAGQAVTLDVDAPTLTIVSIDNGLWSSGVSDPIPAGNVRLRVRIWAGFDSTATPVFSNLLTDQTIPSTFITQPGVATIRGPWVLPNPVTVPSHTPVGVSVAYEVFNGSSWNFSTLAAPIMETGSGEMAAGSSAMPNGKGLYRRLSGTPVTDGNFNPSDYASGGTAQITALYMRIWTKCTGDFTYDQIVDDTDFVSFVNAYDLLDCADSAMPAGCPADLNGDHIVDDADFSTFATAYDALMCS